MYLSDIREKFRNNLYATKADVFGTAVAFLREDIKDPILNDLNVPGITPDSFMLRANQIGLALFDNGYFALAAELYRLLAMETEKHCKDTGNQRHVGAFYANVAGACAVQGNLDQTVIELLRAAEDDVKTYEVAKVDSYAITGLLAEYFDKPTLQAALKAVQPINSSIDLADMDSLCVILGFPRKYAFLAYVHLAVRHEEANRQFPNEFSQLQLFSAIRNLSSLLEVELKTMNCNMHDTFFPALKRLFEGKSWWIDFDKKRREIGASNRSVDDQLGDAIALSPTDNDSRFWQSLLAAYIIRNYTTHQLETQCALIQSYSYKALGHILHVMITASRYC